MDDVSQSQWFPVVTLLLGFVASGLLEYFRDFRQYQRESSARADERESIARQRNQEFQRQTLIDAQDAASKLLRATGKAHYEDVVQFRKSGKWKENLLSNETDQELFSQNAGLSVLSSRLNDEKIRELAGQLRTLCVDAQMAASEKIGDQLLVTIAKVGSEFDERIGAEIRQAFR